MRIVVVDDEAKIGTLIARRLIAEGHEAIAFEAPEAALIEAERQPPDLLITDLKMPGRSGLDVLEHIKRTLPDTEVLLMTAHGSVQTAVEAMKKGACDYLTKPFQFDELLVIVEKIRQNAALRLENKNLKNALAERARFDHIVAVSSEMQEVLDRARRAAASEAPVLIRGESGTGKEVVAGAIHAASRRALASITKINCAALTESLLESELFGHTKGAFTGAHADRRGIFETANGGTLFLDEIGEIAPATQAKLLRVLQDGSYNRVGSSDTLRADVRIVAATNRDLEAAVDSGAFRQDLFYRLNVVPIHMPPLRDRREDVAPLVDFFRARARIAPDSPRRRFTAPAIEALRQYHWPGNVRELQNAVEYALVMARNEQVEPEDLPPTLLESMRGKARGAGSVGDVIEGLSLEDLERSAIVRALDRENWNHTRAAKRLGVTRRTLGYRMVKYDLPSKPGDPKPSELLKAGQPPTLDEEPEESETEVVS